MIQKATLADVKTIQGLINTYADEGRLLPRSLSALYDFIRDFFVARDNNGFVLGACALHIYWENLAEIRSLAVARDARHKGTGRYLVEACLDEARAFGVPQVFVLTYIPSFFERFGFGVVDKSTLPQKIWRDCIHCVKFPNCDEIAMLRKL
jgi:amino-acid N-acetyltransferase